MSATATKITRPWWDVGVPSTPKTDTGWDYTPATGPLAGPGPLYDNNGVASHTPPGAAASGSSPFGYSYSNPGAGFNPWGTYEGGDSYSGSDGPGLYNAQADTKKGWGPNGQGEFDRDRVWRMTLGDLKAKGLDPGSADPAVVQAAYLNNIARLHRDYDQTYGKQAWAGSAFAGYDRLAAQQGGAGGQTTTTPAAKDSGLGGPTDMNRNGGSVIPPAPQTGGSTVDSSGGGNPTPIPTPITPTPTPGGTVATGNGQSVPLGAYYASNPTNAVNQFLQSKGVQINSHDPWSEFLRTLATGIGKTIPQLQPNGPNGQPAYDTLANLPDQLNNLIYGNGGQVFSNVGGYADKALAALTPQINAGMKSTDVESLLQLIEMLKTSGQNPFQKSFNTQALSDLFGQYNQQQQTQGMAGHPLSASWYLQNDPFGLYGAATGQPQR
jgi:hypothetical protein